MMAVSSLPPISDADSIWLHARSAISSAPLPSRILYTIAVTGKDGDTPVMDHYRAVSDPNDATIRIFPISDEQLAHPAPVPHGINWSFVVGLCGGGGCTGIHVPIGRPEASQDLLGEPLLEPTYAFGMRYHHPTGSNDNSDDAGEPLPVVAVVSSQKATYQVSLIDITPLMVAQHTI